MIDWNEARRLRGTDQRGRSDQRPEVPDISEIARNICDVAYKTMAYEPQLIGEYLDALRKLEPRIDELERAPLRHILVDGPPYSSYMTQVAGAVKMLQGFESEAPGLIDEKFEYAGTYTQLMTPTFALFTRMNEIYSAPGPEGLGRHEI